MPRHLKAKSPSNRFFDFFNLAIFTIFRFANPGRSGNDGGHDNRAQNPRQPETGTYIKWIDYAVRALVQTVNLG